MTYSYYIVFFIFLSCIAFFTLYKVNIRTEPDNIVNGSSFSEVNCSHEIVNRTGCAIAVTPCGSFQKSAAIQVDNGARLYLNLESHRKNLFSEFGEMSKNHARYPITDLIVIEGRGQELNPGYTLIPKNLNEGGREMQLAFARSSAKPITDIYVVYLDGRHGMAEMIPDGFEKIDVDLNGGGGGRDLFLVIRRGEGLPIMDFAVTFLSDGEVTPDGFIPIPKDLNRGRGRATKDIEISYLPKKLPRIGMPGYVQHTPDLYPPGQYPISDIKIGFEIIEAVNAEGWFSANVHGRHVDLNSGNGVKVFLYCCRRRDLPPITWLHFEPEEQYFTTPRYRTPGYYCLRMSNGWRVVFRRDVGVSPLTDIDFIYPCNGEQMPIGWMCADVRLSVHARKKYLKLIFKLGNCCKINEFEEMPPVEEGPLLELAPSNLLHASTIASSTAKGSLQALYYLSEKRNVALALPELAVEVNGWAPVEFISCKKPGWNVILMEPTWQASSARLMIDISCINLVTLVTLSGPYRFKNDLTFPLELSFRRDFFSDDETGLPPLLPGETHYSPVTVDLPSSLGHKYISLLRFYNSDMDIHFYAVGFC